MNDYFDEADDHLKPTENNENGKQNNVPLYHMCRFKALNPYAGIYKETEREDENGQQDPWPSLYTWSKEKSTVTYMFGKLIYMIKYIILLNMN